MFWLDYAIEQSYFGWRVKGDTDTEVMDKGLYKPGDVFIVDEKGWLRKTDDLSNLMLKYKMKKELKQNEL
jgi:hypothetical protein